jgi:hypothetical protein
MTAAMKVYIVQEVFSVLLATAAAVMALMLVPSGFCPSTEWRWPCLVVAENQYAGLAIWVQRQSA